MVRILYNHNTNNSYSLHTLFRSLIFFHSFISDCFQFETIIHLPEIGVPLVHMLGAIISGSQVLKHVFVWLVYHLSVDVLHLLLSLLFLVGFGFHNLYSYFSQRGSFLVIGFLMIQREWIFFSVNFLLWFKDYFSCGKKIIFFWSISSHNLNGFGLICLILIFL